MKKVLIYIYLLIPLKKQLFFLLRPILSKFPTLYRKLSFRGEFNVSIENTKFKVFHHGGIIETEIFWRGLFKSWENDTGWIWIQLCKSCNVILDVGANTGIYSLSAKAINPKANVYAFEPSLNTYEKLCLNSKLNNFDIRCEQLAVSNKNGKQIFYDVKESNQTSASLSADKLKNIVKSEKLEYEVETIKLSKYISINHLKQVDLIKIDIELHEPEAIEGLENYLINYKPIVIVEILRKSIADKLNEIIDCENYFIFHLGNSGKPTKCDSFYKVDIFWNFIFFHKSKEAFIKNNTSLFNEN